MIASNQLITVSMGVGGTAAQMANIETGVNSTVSVTTGDGDSTVKIEADNTVYTHSLVDDTVTQTGAGGSQVTVATGNGNNSVNVKSVADGTGNDAGSVVKVTTGSGNDSIVVALGTAGVPVVSPTPPTSRPATAMTVSSSMFPISTRASLPTVATAPTPSWFRPVRVPAPPAWQACQTSKSSK